MMYFLWNPVTFLIVSWLFENINAISCPTDRITWEEKAGNFTCVESSFVYHCILDDTDRLVETCAARESVPEGKPGCPVVSFRDGVAYHLVDNSECPLTNPFCPSGKSAYYSDQLYLYPACFLNEGDRSSYGRSTPDTSFGYEYPTEKTTYGYENVVVNNNNIEVIIVLVLLLLVSVAVNVVMYIYYKRKKNIKEKRGEPKTNAPREELEKRGEPKTNAPREEIDKQIQQELVELTEHTKENGYPVHEEE